MGDAGELTELVAKYATEHQGQSRSKRMTRSLAREVGRLKFMLGGHGKRLANSAPRRLDPVTSGYGTHTPSPVPLP